MTIEPGRELLRLVRQAAVRLTVSRAGQAAARAGALAMAAFVLLNVAGVVIPVSGVPMAHAIAAAGLAALLAGVLVVLVRPVPRVDTARALDATLRLEERVSTAMEVLASALPRSLLAKRVVTDAERRLSAVGVAAVTPLQVPRTFWWTAALTALLFVLTSWLHGITIPGTPAHRTAEVIRKEGQRLEQFARTLQSRTRAEHMPATRHLTPQIRDLGSRLQRERLARAEALARIEELSQQLEQTRREIDERLQASRPAPSRERDPSDALRRQSTQRQIRQLRELLSRLQQDSSSASRDALDQLNQMAAGGEGTQPARVRDQLQRAREQLERGNMVGARDAVSDAMLDLQGLESLMADSEAVRNAQQQVERSQAAIAGGAPVEGQPEGQETEQTSESPVAPGEQRPSASQGEDSEPPQGPNEGSTPGTGQGNEKIGARTPRLDTTKTPQRVRGAQSEGPVASSEIVGTGRSSSSRVQAADVSPAVIARADQAMTRSRTPARYRDIVRRYFQRLAKLR
ncbi:MAG TPA: hypothetical protein VFH67_02135 [bacterium]|nr:hypothetical protein [bacterium]